MSWKSYLEDPLLVEFVPVVVNRALRALVRRGYESEAVLLDRPPITGVLDTIAGGRRAHPLVELTRGERAVLRAYHRGGLFRHVNSDRYFLGHRALEELRSTEYARLRGVRAPVVLAAVERRRALGYTAVLATRWIEGAHDLFQWLSTGSAEDRALALRETGRQIGAMHAAGLAHPDLNLRNVLVQQTSGALRAYLLDFDRARILSGPLQAGRRKRALQRFARSARKLGIRLERDDWGELRRGYGSGWPWRASEG